MHGLCLTTNLRAIISQNIISWEFIEQKIKWKKQKIRENSNSKLSIMIAAMPCGGNCQKGGNEMRGHLWI